jgi:hypothetical protein
VKIATHNKYIIFHLRTLVIGILFNECDGFRRARLNGTFEGFGMARRVCIRSAPDMIRYVTYLIVPDDGSTSGVISIPFSMTFDISNTASDIAMDNQAEASARWIPVNENQLNVRI